MSGENRSRRDGYLRRFLRGLNRARAAEYIGVSPVTFDDMVKNGRMPPPKAINARRVWDRHALDAAFAELDDAGATTSAGTSVDNLPGWEDA